MQNLTEGQSVVVEGKVATVTKINTYSVDVILEDGTIITTSKSNIQPRSFLTENK